MRVTFILLVCLLTLSLAAAPAMAKVTSSAAMVHIVKSGDSLYEIAKQHGMTVNELKRLNGLSSNRLKIGQRLALNRAAAPPLPETAKNPEPVSAKNAVARQMPAGSVHVVKKGETLKTIARAHSLSVEQLQQFNQLQNSKLKIGQQLALALPEDGVPLAVNTPAPAKRYSYASRELHVVKRGETLASISRRHHVSVKELKRLNGLRSNNLKIGQQLALNDPYEERNPILLPGDSNDEEILEMAYSSESELEQAAFNFLSTPYRFGGTSRRGIDCSSFVQQVFREVDVDLPRSAREQFRIGTKVERDDLQPGDLVFFRTYARFPSHVGIYLGDNKMIHASSRSHRVVVTSLDLPYYRKRFIGAKRISLLDEDIPEEATDTALNDATLLDRTEKTADQADDNSKISRFDPDKASGDAGKDAEEEEEAGDVGKEEEYLVPPAQKFAPATEPLKPLAGGPATPPVQQTALTTRVASVPAN